MSQNKKYELTIDDIAGSWSIWVVSDWIRSLKPRTIHERDKAQLRIILSKAFEKALKMEMPPENSVE